METLNRNQIQQLKWITTVTKQSYWQFIFVKMDYNDSTQESKLEQQKK